MKLILICMMVMLAVSNPPEPRPYADEIKEISQIYELNPYLLTAMIEAESSFNPDVVSSCGATGLMQIMPKWHETRMERLGVDDLSDIYSNILVGADYIAELIDLYEGNEAQALMVYNMGWYGSSLYKDGVISKYATGILQRAEEMKAEDKKNERHSNKPGRPYGVRLWCNKGVFAGATGRI